MDICLVKFHEALINVPYGLSGVSTPEFMEVEWIQHFPLRCRVHRCCELTADCNMASEVEEFMLKPAPCEGNARSGDWGRA